MATMAKDDHHHRSVCVTELTQTLCATSCVCATLVEDNVEILVQQAKERTLVSSHCNMHCGAHCTRTQSKRMFCNVIYKSYHIGGQQQQRILKRSELDCLAELPHRL